MTESPPRRLLRLFRAPRGVARRLVLAGAILLTLVALAGAVGFFRTPGRVWAIGFTTVAPYLLPAALLAVLAFAAIRQWIGAAVATVLTVVWIVTQAPAYVAADPPAHARDITVLTANMRVGEADARQLVEHVRAHRVDALMVEELTPEAQDRLVAAGLDRLLPHRITAPAAYAFGTGLWSRFPLQRIRTGPLVFESIAARAQIPGVAGHPTLVALHPAGPYPDPANWHVDYGRLQSWFAALPKDGPIVAGGDFNATASVSQFRDLLDGDFRDAAEQAGAGPIATWPADKWYPPVIGIDHVLTRDAVARDADTVDLTGSDHMGLVVTVALPRTS